MYDGHLSAFNPSARNRLLMRSNCSGRSCDVLRSSRKDALRFHLFLKNSSTGRSPSLLVSSSSSSSSSSFPSPRYMSTPVTFREYDRQPGSPLVDLCCPGGLARTSQSSCSLSRSSIQAPLPNPQSSTAGSSTSAGGNCPARASATLPPQLSRMMRFSSSSRSSSL